MMLLGMRFTVSSWNKLPVTRALKREHLNWWMHITVPIPQAANYSCFTAAPIYICHKNLQQKLYCRSSIIIFTAPLKFCLKTPQKVAALQNFIFYSSSPHVHVCWLYHSDQGWLSSGLAVAGDMHSLLPLLFPAAALPATLPPVSQLRP